MSPGQCRQCGRPLITFPGDIEATCAECRSLPDSCPCDPLPAETATAVGGRPFRQIDLSSLVRDGVPPPELLCGDLLYQGGLHSISGPPDSGKTTIALWWLLQEARAGRRVAFLDEEGGAELVAEKLIALGATERDAALISYFPFPARSWTPLDVEALHGLINVVRPTVVLWDSAAAFLSRAGLDENSAADVTKFWAQVLTPIAREHGAAVVVIDHDTKDTATASRYARGSGAKLAACDVAFKIEIVTAFSRTANGVMRMKVSKDRRGWLHRSWTVAINTNGGMNVTLTEAEDNADGQAVEQQLTPADRKVQNALTAEPSTIQQITDRIAEQNGHGLTRQTVSDSLNKLLRRGVADRLDQGKGRPALWSVYAGQTCQATGSPDKAPNLSSAA
jgi:hypothetical protein